MRMALLAVVYSRPVKINAEISAVRAPSRSISPLIGNGSSEISLRMEAGLNNVSTSIAAQKLPTKSTLHGDKA